jgi:hypothetical protein
MLRIFLEHFGDEMFGDSGDGDMVWKAIVAHLDSIVGSLHVVCFKGRTAHKASVGYHS